MKKKWTQSKVISEIQALHHEGQPIHERFILLNRNDLRCAARKIFGSYRKALDASGFSPDTIAETAKQSAVIKRKKWTKTIILDTLTKRARQGKFVHYNALVRDGFGSMCFAITREFGSFRQAVEAAGINYDKIKGDRDFENWATNPELILQKIQDLNSSGYELNYSSVQSHDKTLCWAARKYFGSWYKAVAKAGFNEEAVRRDRDREADKGNIFENICYEIFSVLRPLWQKEVRIDCGSYTTNPDYYDPETGQWIDFKLRAYGESTELSIKKYHKHAPSLCFIYLLGNRESNNSLFFYNIFQFEHEALGLKIHHLFEDLRNLESYKPPPIHLEKWAIRWTKKKIIKWIQKQPTEALSERTVLNENNDLRCAARRLFGSWQKALIAGGIDPKAVRKQRAKIERDELDQFITTRWEKSLKLNPRYICDNFPGEYSAAIRIYGGWRQAVVGNAIPYEKVIRKKSGTTKR